MISLLLVAFFSISRVKKKKTEEFSLEHKAFEARIEGLV